MLKFIIMFARLFYLFLLFAYFIPTISAYETEYFYMTGEPIVRIGLIDQRAFGFDNDDRRAAGRGESG